MKKNVLILTVALMVSMITACAGTAKTIVPGKNYKTKKVKVESFDGLSTSTSIDIVYTQTSGSPVVEIYAPDNLIDYVQVKVKNGILSVGFKSDKDKGITINGKHKTEVRVSAPAVHTFRASSSGDIILSNGLHTSGTVSMKSSSSGDIEGGTVKCDVLEIAASSSGDIELKQVECTTLNASASSSGDIALKGTCRTANLSASSSGDVKAKGLKADKVNAKASSAGDITCYPVESLNATTSSSGSVNYKGNPSHINYYPKKGLNKID